MENSHVLKKMIFGKSRIVDVAANQVQNQLFLQFPDILCIHFTQNVYFWVIRSLLIRRHAKKYNMNAMMAIILGLMLSVVVVVTQNGVHKQQQQVDLILSFDINRMCTIRYVHIRKQPKKL